MAKKSMIQRELKREKLVAKYAAKRAKLKEIIRNPNTGDAERAAGANTRSDAGRESDDAATD